MLAPLSFCRSPSIGHGCRVLRSCCCITPLVRETSRLYSTDIDFSHEKPAPVQLEHVQQRVQFTVPLMFKQRMDYTFYRHDVICDDQIFRLQKQGIEELMKHFGWIGSLGQFTFPHIEMELISVIPMIDDGTVRCRWRIKYLTFMQLLSNPRLFKFEYRLQNLSWFDGYSVLTVDGNGKVYRITLQRMQKDDSPILNLQSAKDKIVEKMKTLSPRNEPIASFRYCPPRKSDDKK